MTLKRFALGSAVIIAFLVILFFAMFGLHRGSTHAIRNRLLRIIPGSIAKLERVPIGGVNQWLLIRGADKRQPVLLFVHGGPGMANMYLAHTFQKRLEREFVVVEWDQRGAGKSYDAREPVESLTVRRTLNDLYEVTNRLRRQFHQERIYLVGHSWGSYVGMLAVKEHPEYYRAFIGVGQVAADSARERAVQRAWLEKTAVQTNDVELIERMKSYGDITESDIFRHRGELRTHNSFLPLLSASFRAPEYTWRDVLNIRRGADFVREHMKSDVIVGSLQSNVRAVHVPVFFFLGAHDYTTPSQLAVDYMRQLDAPYKRIVWFPKSAHFPYFEERRRFAAAMHRVKVQTEAYWTR